MRVLAFHLCGFLLACQSGTAVPIPAQATNSSSCPRVTVECPDTVRAGTPVVFRAHIQSAGNPTGYGFRWVVSAGAITKGQGSPAITVDTAGLNGQPITATLEVVGMPAGCPNRFRCDTAVPVSHSPMKVAEYTEFSREVERRQLDSFAAALRRALGAQGYILSYAAERGSPGQARARAERARGYLERTSGLDGRRIRVVYGGRRRRAVVELFIVPAGFSPPQPTPIPERRFRH